MIVKSKEFGIVGEENQKMLLTLIDTVGSVHREVEGFITTNKLEQLPIVSFVPMRLRGTSNMLMKTFNSCLDILEVKDKSEVSSNVIHTMSQLQRFIEVVTLYEKSVLEGNNENIIVYSSELSEILKAQEL